MTSADVTGGVEIVDAHHHLIELKRIAYPWIATRDPALQALLPNYYDAAHQYSPQDYCMDVDAEPITASVACEFGAADGVTEANWVQECAARFGLPNAFIRAASLGPPKPSAFLARYHDL